MTVGVGDKLPFDTTFQELRDGKPTVSAAWLGLTCRER
jgi:hypothetical protein